jgi:N-acetylmuramoyl-L-alanine amidase
MRSIAISAGHSLKVRGASGSPIPPFLDEYDENVRVVNEVYALLQTAGVPVVKFIDTTSTTQNENLNRIVNWHNAQSRDLDVSIHFNASSQSANLMGDEVLYVSNSGLSVATPTAAAIAGVASWPNRGAKFRDNLFFLNKTNKPAVLVEVCFVTSSADGNRYRERFAAICSAIAGTVAGVAIGPAPPDPGPDPTPPDPTPPDPGPTPEVVTLTLSADKPVTLSVVAGDNVTLAAAPEPPPPDAIPSYQQNIIATVFNGNGSNGAYGIPIPPASSPALYLALPWKDQANKGRPARVINPATGQEAVGLLWDLGPWFTDDNYPQLQERPLAETLHAAGQPCPRGPNKGKVPNGAGIDLSPALAAAVGISGKGLVNWQWEDVTA